MLLSSTPTRHRIGPSRRGAAFAEPRRQLISGEMIRIELDRTLAAPPLPRDPIYGTGEQALEPPQEPRHGRNDHETAIVAHCRDGFPRHVLGAGEDPSGRRGRGLPRTAVHFRLAADDTL